MKNGDYSYYSNLLKQPFATLDALRAAEDEAKAKTKAIEKAKEDKKLAATKVNDLYAKYVEVTKSANKQIEEARKAYEEAKAEFIKQYGSYHMTYTSPDGKEKTEVSEVYSSNIFDTLDDFLTLVDKYLRG